MPTCTDTDGGINYPVFGYVYGRNGIGSNYRYNDQCSGSTLWERYCVGNSPAVQSYGCSHGCSSGRCNPTNTTNTTQCQDRRDNDADGLIDYPSDPGCVALTDNDEYNAPPNNGSNSTTQCNDRLDNDNDGHRDYVTVSSNPDSKCSSTADNSESPRDSCADSDNGISSFTLGTATGDDESVPYRYTDVCLNVDQLREYFCGNYAQDYAPLNTVINCRNQTNTTNSTCSSGRCV